MDSRATRCQTHMQKEIIQTSRILIVDDQAQNVLLLERALRGAGYTNISGITDSREALRTFSEFRPDLVAIDLRMPHVDGFALLKQFRSRVPRQRLYLCLVLTADNSRKAKQEALALGAYDFLTKPLDLAGGTPADLQPARDTLALCRATAPQRDVGSESTGQDRGTGASSVGDLAALGNGRGVS